MRRSITLAALVFGLWAAPGVAQSPEPQRQQRRRPSPQQQAAQRSQAVVQVVPIEGVIGYLAFEADLADSKLLGAREALRPVYDQRQELIQGMQANPDMDALKQEIVQLRKGMVTNLEPVVPEGQLTKLRQLLGVGVSAPPAGGAAPPQ